MNRSQNIYRMEASEIEELYIPVAGTAGSLEDSEVEYMPLVPWVQGNTIARKVRDGFYLHWASEIFDREVRLRLKDGEDYIAITFTLEGGWQDLCGSRRHLFDRPAGTMALIRYGEIHEHRAMKAQKALHLSLVIESSKLVAWLGEERLRQHSRLYQFLKGTGDASLILPLTQCARLIVEQIQHCPFHGLTRTLALEARCIDLLVEIIERVQNTPTSKPGLRRLSRQELERIHSIAEKLKRSLTEPPSLTELAQEFNLSESKLKSGFHQVFGTTTFGYLRQMRMDQARRLLISGECSILEAAHLVGINNPSHFASLFKQHFGSNPKQFQMNGDWQK